MKIPVKAKAVKGSGSTKPRAQLPAFAGAPRPGRADVAGVHGHLTERGLLLWQGTIVDAMIIHAPVSTRIRDRVRDLEMH